MFEFKAKMIRLDRKRKKENKKCRNIPLKMREIKKKTLKVARQRNGEQNRRDVRSKKDKKKKLRERRKSEKSGGTIGTREEMGEGRKSEKSW